MYALGYTYKPNSEQSIVKSGLIYLSTVPQGAGIYLNNRRFVRKTPTVIGNLIPGEYEVKLVRKKHQLWANTLPVEAGKATVLERILLLPEEWKQKVLIANEFRDTLPIFDGRFFLLKQGQGEKVGDFSIYDSREETVSSLLASSIAAPDLKVSSYFTIEGSPYLFLELGAKEKRKLLWMSLKGQDSSIKDVTSLFASEFKEMSWDLKDKKYLFAYQDGLLHRIDTTSDILTSPFLVDVLGYGFFDRKIYVLKKDLSLERTDLDGKKEKVLFQDPVVGATLFKPDDFYKIKIFSEDLFSEPIVLFLSNEGALRGNRLPYRFVEKGVRGIDFNSKYKRLVIWTDKALGVLDFSNKKSDEELFESAPKLFWLATDRKKIEQAFWVYDGSHVLFREQNKVFLLELETYGSPGIRELLTVKDDSSIYYSDESGKLFFLEPETGHFMSLQLLPKWEVLTSAFIEEKGQERKFKILEL